MDERENKKEGKETLIMHHVYICVSKRKKEKQRERREKERKERDRKGRECVCVRARDKRKQRRKAPRTRTRRKTKAKRRKREKFKVKPTRPSLNGMKCSQYFLLRSFFIFLFLGFNRCRAGSMGSRKADLNTPFNP